MVPVLTHAEDAVAAVLAAAYQRDDVHRARNGAECGRASLLTVRDWRQREGSTGMRSGLEKNVKRRSYFQLGLASWSFRFGRASGVACLRWSSVAQGISVNGIDCEGSFVAEDQTRLQWGERVPDPDPESFLSDWPVSDLPCWRGCDAETTIHVAHNAVAAFVTVTLSHNDPANAFSRVFHVQKASRTVRNIATEKTPKFKRPAPAQPPFENSNPSLRAVPPRPKQTLHPCASPSPPRRLHLQLPHRTPIMVNDESSPDPEITVRSPNAPLPTFAGLALPSPLRELRQQHIADAPSTPHPSELTALAIRLKKVRLDTSPTDAESPLEYTPVSLTKPIRLDFGEGEPGYDKENVDNGATVSDSGKPPRTPKRKVKERAVEETIVESETELQHEPVAEVEGDFVQNTVKENVESPEAAAKEARADVEEESPNDASSDAVEADSTELVAEGHEDANEIIDDATPLEVDVDDVAHPTDADVDVDTSPADERPDDAAEDVPDANDSAPIVQEDETNVVSTETVTNCHEHTATDADADQPLPLDDKEASAGVELDEELPYIEQNTSTDGAGAVEMADVGETAFHQGEFEDMKQTVDAETLVSTDAPHNDVKEGSTFTPAHGEEVDPVPPNSETEAKSTGETESHAENAVSPKGEASDGASSTRTEPVLQDADDSEGDAGVFAQQFRIVLEGREKWSWPKRCEAMSTVTQTMIASPSDRVISVVRKATPDLSNAVNDNLDELRPSIITSALSLINSVLSSRADEGSDFAEQVFPSVMDLSCGRSLTAQEAARSVALVLDFHPELSSILEDADNPDRLIELLQLDVAEENGDPVSRSRAQKAMALVHKVVNGGGSEDALSPGRTDVKGVPKVVPQATDTPKSGEKRRTTLDASAAPSGAGTLNKLAGKGASPLSACSASGSPHAAVEGRTPRHHRFSERVGPVSSSGIKATPRQSLRVNMSDIRLSTPLVRNKKLGKSVRKTSPASSRKSRMYTEEDMEEARSAAIRVVMEETSQREAKKRSQHQAEIAALEKSLRKEKSEVTELKSVLEEYELTMQKMVAQGNSQASAYCASLEKETKKLKAELLEVTEAYESVKERYDGAKQALKVYENKETRFIEQIRGLKKNMTELQKWSDELKANCEKKLAKAFNQVTTYRASYMEAEAHRNKAATDLERARSDLAKEVTNHAETAAALSRLEVSLHEEQDSRSSLEASLSSAKDSLARLTSQKDRLQKEVSTSQEELRKTTAKLSELEDAETRATNASKQLETFTAERQSLKARAYDDMTRIRGLESELEVKDKEYQELNAICEEALSQLEKARLQES